MGALADTSITVQDLASIQAQGGIISQTTDFTGVDSDTIASRIGIRELRQQSTPLARVRFIANREAWNINPGDVIRLSWGNLGITSIILRVTQMDYGTLESGLVMINAIEDIFGLPSNSYAVPVPSGWSDSVTAPLPAPSSLAIETPYYVLATTLEPSVFALVDEDSCYVNGVIESPDQPAFAAHLAGRVGAAIYDLLEAGELSPTAEVDQAIGFEDTTGISIRNFKGSISEVVIGGYGYINGEAIRVDALDVSAGTVTIGRGVFDTIPQEHSTGSVIYFADSNIVFPMTEYSVGITLDTLSLPQTSLGVLPFTSALPGESVTFVGRQNMPYGPSQVRINNEFFPSVSSTALIRVTWAHQDRTQQLAGIEDWYNVSLGQPEEGVTYNVRYINNANNLVLFSETGLTGTESSFLPATDVGVASVIRIEVEAIRNNISNFRTFSHLINYAKPVEIRTTLNNDTRITSTGDVRILEN